jgi:hypothetical protein
MLTAVFHWTSEEDGDYVSDAVIGAYGRLRAFGGDADAERKHTRQNWVRSRHL